MKTSGHMHSKATSLIGIIAALAVLASVVSTATAQPAPGLQYTFVQGVDDPTMPNGINDVSGHGHNGTVIDSTLAEMVPGPAGKMNAIHLDGVNGPDETQGSGINTGIPVDSADLNIWLGPFTTMAWVNLDDFGERMVFGTPKPHPSGTGSLHIGFRGSAAYFGFWGASRNRDGQAPLGFSPGEWHHVAWRYDGAGAMGPDTVGNQDIFIDGQMFVSHQNAPFYGSFLSESNEDNVVTNLLIGRTVANNGAFNGSLADVRVYPIAVGDDDIAAIAASPP
jgi:hypothetical protein